MVTRKEFVGRIYGKTFWIECTCPKALRQEWRDWSSVGRKQGARGQVTQDEARAKAGPHHSNLSNLIARVKEFGFYTLGSSYSWDGSYSLNQICLKKQNTTYWDGTQRPPPFGSSPSSLSHFLEHSQNPSSVHPVHQQSRVFTCWKQLRTLGSILLPPKAATSPSCRGIWMASWSKRPSCRWSHISVGPATSLKRSARRRGKRLTSICLKCSLMSLVMGIEQWRLKKKSWGRQSISHLLNSDNLDILCVCNQELVNHMLLKTTSCCKSIHINRPVTTNFLYKWYNKYVWVSFSGFSKDFLSYWERQWAKTKLLRTCQRNKCAIRANLYILTICLLTFCVHS